MQECNICKDAGFPTQQISFEKIGENLLPEKISGNQVMKTVTNINTNSLCKIIQGQYFKEGR